MSVQEAVRLVEAHLLGRMEDGTYVAPWVSFTAQEIRESLWKLHDKCICTPAIAGISDGPSMDCPQHGDAQDATYPTLSTLRAALRAYGDYRRQSSHMNASIHSQAMRAALRAALATTEE